MILKTVGKIRGEKDIPHSAIEARRSLRGKNPASKSCGSALLVNMGDTKHIDGRSAAADLSGGSQLDLRKALCRFQNRGFGACHLPESDKEAWCDLCYLQIRNFALSIPI